MLKLLPILLALGYALILYRVSATRMRALLDAQSRPLNDAGLSALTDRLARALDLPAITVHVFEVDPVNGLAAPDGRIFLTRGFLDRKTKGEVTDAELASVVAHELGHIAHGHLRRRMIDVTGQNAVFMMLASLLGRFVPVVGVLLARSLSTALMAHLSRRDEFEADAYASALLIKSGIGTAPQKSLFRKLGALTGNGARGAPAWLASHPATQDRIAAIEANEARWTLPAA